jgi:hypothetical protein
MKKLVLLVTFISISSFGLGMDNVNSMYYKALLKEQRIFQDIKEIETHPLFTINNIATKTITNLENRQEKLESQIQSRWARLYHFVYRGISQTAFGGFLGWGSYKILCDSYFSENRTFLNHFAYETLLSPFIGSIASIFIAKGTRSMYNNIFHWKEHKQNKLKRTVNALALFEETDDEEVEEEL